MKMPKLPQDTGPRSVVGVVWYREADWPRIKELFPDADQLQDTYSEWLKSAEESLKQINRRGLVTERCILDLGEFLGWCLAKGRRRDAAARTEFVTEKLQRKYQSLGR